MQAALARIAARLHADLRGVRPLRLANNAVFALPAAGLVVRITRPALRRRGPACHRVQLDTADLAAAPRSFHALGIPPFELPRWDPIGDAVPGSPTQKRSTTPTGATWSHGAIASNPD